MDTTSESNSVKSVGTTSLKTPNSTSPNSRKQVGFAKARPRLIIPSPQEFRLPPQYVPGTAGIAGTAQYTPGVTVNPAFFRKQSEFIFDQLHGIKDLTVSGLGAGEKWAYWLYNKLKKWSRQWFTHMFLTIILVLYTVGGAFIFETIEGSFFININSKNKFYVFLGAHENAKNNKTITNLEIIDVRASRMKLIQELRELSLKLPNKSLDDEWTKQAQDLFENHKSVLIENEQRKRELEKEHKKKWSFSNAVVYCGTVYTSIGMYD